MYVICVLFYLAQIRVRKTFLNTMGNLSRAFAPFLKFFNLLNNEIAPSEFSPLIVILAEQLSTTWEPAYV